MSILLRTYQPIRRKEFAYGDANVNLNNVFHILDFLESIHKNVFSRKAFASSCIPVHPGKLRLSTAVLSNLQQDTDIILFPSENRKSALIHS